MELSRQELTLEDFIDGFVTYTRELKHPKLREMDIMIAYKSQRFSKPLACKELRMTADELDNFLESIRQRICLKNGSTVEEVIDGYIRLWRRLDRPDAGEWDWMSAYQRNGFDRRKTAGELGMPFKAFEMRLTRLRKKLGIKERSDR